MSSSTSTNVAENGNSCTEVRTERIVHNWTIKRFDLLPEDVGKEIYSPWFYSRDKSEKWYLQFYPRGRIDSSTGGINYVALFLVRDSPGKSQIRVLAKLKISKSNITLKDLSFTHKYIPQDNCGYHQFLERSKLLTTTSSDNDEFTITCTIDIPAEVKTSSFDTAIFDSGESQLSDDLRLLFEDPIFSDFTIIVGDQKFPTHRYILAKRSPVFAAMFEHKDLEENRKEEVKIENIEPDVIKGMLEFIYTDQVSSIKELASGLLEAADKYDLEKLRIMCEKVLYEGINKENAAEVLQLADLHHADKLKKYVIKYIVDHAPEVVKSDNWKDNKCDRELLIELFDQMALSLVANNGKSQSSKA